MSKKQSMGRLMTKAAFRAGAGRIINRILDNFLDMFSGKNMDDAASTNKKSASKTKARTKKVVVKK